MENGRIVDYIRKLYNEERLRGLAYSEVVNKWVREHPTLLMKVNLLTIGCKLLEIAYGLEYLHHEQVVHGDLHGVRLESIQYRVSLNV